MAEIQHWKGFRELEENLKMLGAEVHEKGVKRMMSRAAVPMRDDARRRAPVLKTPDPRRRAGTLQRAIQIWRKRITRYAVTYYVGVRGLSRKAMRAFKEKSGSRGVENPNDPFYWRWQELGVPSRGIPAQGFLRKAFEAQKTESVRVALLEGREFVRKTAAKFKKTRR